MAKADAPSLDGARSAKPWQIEIEKALKREEVWRGKARKVVQRYRDERAEGSASSKVNILWSNTAVLQAALYGRVPKPDVRRRFADGQMDNGASRQASEVIERSVSYSIDAYDVDSSLDPAIEDMLIAGRGMAWVSYDPEIEEVGESEPPSEDDDEPVNDDESEPKEARIVGQKLCLEYVYWEDFTHGLSRTWRDCPWVARRHAMARDEFEAKFPDAKSTMGNLKLKDSSDGEGEGSFIEVWEVWAKSGKERIYIGKDYDDILQADPDPLGLVNFFPCAEPIYSVTTTDTRMPIPEFLQYQDQAAEIDKLSTRINRLVEQMRWRGIYDATVDKDGSTLKGLENADDGTLLPHENFQALREKGGLEGAVAFLPIERIYPIVAQLQQQLTIKVGEIYQITGISDIMRGQTDPNETKGAQQMKAQFGSMRMQRRQGKVQKFIRDTYRIMAEIIAEHFTQETLAQITGIEMPTDEEQKTLQAQLAAQQAMPPPVAPGGPPAPVSPDPMSVAPGPQTPPTGATSDYRAMLPVAGGNLRLASQQNTGPLPLASPTSGEDLERAHGPTWEQVMAILRSDKIRGYRVDIETDSTMAVDADSEKAARLEFVGAMEKSLAGAYQAMMVAPQMLPLIKEVMLFTMRSFRPGKALEEGVETAFDELTKNPPKPPTPPDPNAGKAEADKARLALEAQKHQDEMAHKNASLQADQAHRQAALQVDTAHKAQTIQLDAKDKADRLQIDREKAQAQAAIEAAKLEHMRTAHSDTMTIEQMKMQQAEQNKKMDMGLAIAGHNKQIATEGMQPAELGGPSALEQISQTVQEFAAMSIQGTQAIMDAQMQLGQRVEMVAQEVAKIDGEVQQVAGAVNSMAAAADAPVEIIRDGQGKAAGIRKAGVIHSVVRGPDGKLVGMQ